MEELGGIVKNSKKILQKLISFADSLFIYLKIPIRTLPDFIVIGCTRCGTTSFFNYLSEHPLIHPSKRKEVHYFGKYFQRGVFWYRSFFPLKLNKYYHKYVLQRKFITGEASPAYIFKPYVAKRIYSLTPKVKLVILLRNPIDRAYSDYHFTIREDENHNKKKKENLSFKDAIESEDKRIKNISNKFAYKWKGLYIKHIKRWLTYFPRGRFLIFQSEAFFKNPNKILKEFYDFMNLPYFRKNTFRIFHTTKKKEEMDPQIRKELIDYFAPYNHQLYEFLGKNFDWNE